MKKLDSTYRRHGYTYQLVDRNEHAAIFSQANEDGKVVAYEVGKVKIGKEVTIAGKTIEAGERFWVDEDFGVIAWTYADFDRAVAVFRQLTPP